MADARQDIIDALKTARRAKGLTQRALSQRVGVPQSHISKIENGETDLRLSSLIELALALDLHLALIPRQLAPAVAHLVRSAARIDHLAPSAPQLPLAPRPAYRLDEEDDA